MKNKQSGIALALALCLLSAPAAQADEQAASTRALATEYLSETLFENFESPSVPTATVPVSAALPEISATSAVLMEASTGRVLAEVNADEQRAPASITKIMTLLLVMEAVDEGRFTPETTVAASEHACSMGGSQIWLEPGETMTVHDLLKATAVASANDAATALGELVDGSEEAFVDHMNRRAAELGMTGTHFVNCCGLDAEGHVSTARDIAVMSCALLRHDLIKQFSQIWIDYLRGGTTQLVNTNKLVRFYPGTTGLKTGTTDRAGYCVSASAEREDMELVAVVLDGATSDKRFADAKALLNYGFANWTLQPVDLAGQVPATLPVTRGTAPAVDVVCDLPDRLLIPKGRGQDLTPVVELPDDVEAPVAPGQLLGRAVVTLDGQPVGECRLTAASGVDRLTFGRALTRMLAALTGG